MDKPFKFTIAEIIFIALMSAANAVFDYFISPGFIALFTHIVAGIFIMVPINFLFLTLTKMVVNKYGSLSLYLVIFGALAIPTTLFGAVPGIYKVVVGLAIGLILDLVYLPPRTWIKIISAAILGSILWWTMTYIVWQTFGLSFVEAFANLLDTVIPIHTIINLPITGFSVDFFLFALVCGILSAGPVLIGCLGGFALYKKIAKTALYERFKNMK